MNQNYDPKLVESQIYKLWQEQNIGNPDFQQNLTGNPQNQDFDPSKSDTLKSKKTHSILMPPPNLTGNMHAGHSFQHYLMDTLSRTARQNGQKDLWIPGVDHAGLQLEGVIDKLIKQGEFNNKLEAKNSPLEGCRLTVGGVVLKNNETILREDLPKYLKTNYPDLWLEFAWSKVNLWRDNQKTQASVLGDTPDYSRNLFTLDQQNLDMVNYAFKKYWQDGLIYKGSYLVNWSVGLQTALSDVSGEIDYEKRIDPMVTFEYQIFKENGGGTPSTIPLQEGAVGGGTFINESILVSTVRPETIFGDFAVAVHPTIWAKKYSHLDIDKIKVQIPLTDKLIPVILAEEVDPHFGSGALKITPANDAVDYEIFNKYLGGDFESAIGRDGKLTNICGKYSGLKVQDARLEIIKNMVEQGLVPKKINPQNQDFEPLEGVTPAKSKKYFGIEFAENINPEEYQIDWNYEHNVTICERTKTVVEPLISEEFFISYHNKFQWKPIAKDDNISIANANQTKTLQELGIEAVNKTKFFSSEYKERGINFLENIKDWCISRDLIWGHKMPVWYNLDLNPDKIFYSHQQILENINLTQHFQISPYKPDDKRSWVQEEKILDTWFSSCLWPLSSLKYPEFLKQKRKKSNLVFIGGGEIWKDEEIYQSKIQSGELNSYWYNSSFGSGQNWKTKLSDFCKKNYICQIKPQMPNKTNASYDEWKAVFEQSLPHINSKTILIGHSLGSMFLLRYLSENQLNYKAVFLISGGLWTKEDQKKADFSEDWLPKNIPLQGGAGGTNLDSKKTFIVHSSDDKVVPFEKSQELARLLPNANFISLENYGHLNSNCNELLEIIVSQIKTPNLKLTPSSGGNEITDFEVFYPTTTMTTGKDIFYNWIVRMTALSYYFTAQIPYQNLVVTPTVLDDKGKKMSKSLGNGMDPVAQINKYSSDALRLAMLGNMIPDRNIKMGGRIADDLCEKYRNFGNKMWNIARFFEYQDNKLDSKKDIN